MGTYPRGVPRENRVVPSRKERLSAAPPATDSQPSLPKYASKLPGDPDALRGIPAIGRGVGGAIRHTNPETAITCRPIIEGTITARIQPE